ncbi:MAG: NUDIX domain-containing protein [Rhodocyclales bacterium]|nr:NUDIX domain-containing protein [Rhodocyclales bacterium]
MPKPVKHRSAGIVVLLAQSGGWRVLLLRAYRHWDFPKGLLAAGETPLQAALRETREETGLENVEFTWGRESQDTAMYGDRKVASYFLARAGAGEVTLLVNPELGRPEHDEFRWASFAEARTLLPPRLLPILEWARRKVEGGVDG